MPDPATAPTSSEVHVLTAPPAPASADPAAVYKQREDFLKLVMSWLAVLLVLVAAVAAFGYLIVIGISQDVWLNLARDQFPLVIGLPGSASIALFVVLVLRISSGPITLELGSVKFAGAAAPIVFWLFCFLALATMVEVLWID